MDMFGGGKALDGRFEAFPMHGRVPRPPVPRGRPVEPVLPPGKWICTHVALMRVRRKLGDFPRDRLYRLLLNGRIKGIKPGDSMRSDGKQSNASWKISEESLERWISRTLLEREMF